MKQSLSTTLGLSVLVFALLSVACTRRENTAGKEAPGEYPNDWFYRQRAYPYAELRSDLYYKAMEQARAMEEAGLKSGEPEWELVGPVNIGGRITDVEMPSEDPNTIYLCAASGGIFKSSNLGTSWIPVFDDAVALAVGDLDISKSNNEILYAGTGEPNAGGGSHTYEGYGVYRSNDSGRNWINCGLRSAGSIGRVKIHPANPDIVYVAAMGHLFAYNSERGVFRTRDGGNSWQKVLFLNDSTGASDLCIHPANPDIIYASMWERTRRPNYQSYGGKSSGIWKSADGGETWNELLNGLPKGNVGRIGIDIADSSPSVLYATYTDSSGFLKGIYKTVDGGASWTATPGTISEGMSYWWWFSEIDVDPINPNIAYVSGFQAYKTVNGGASWNLTFASAHVDMHGVFIHPRDNALALLCSDDGLYVSRSGGNTHFHIETLPITQFYTCEVDYQNPTRYYGGTQDNGTIRVTNGMVNRWQSIYGGDGFVVKVDPSDNNYVYAEYQYGGLGRSTDGGTNFMYATSGIDGNDRKNWKSPIELDPSKPSTLYFGTNRLYRSTDRAASWRPCSPDLTNGPGVNITYGTITTISVSPLDPAVIYAGTDDGNVWNTLNGGTTWNNLSSTLPDRWITCVQASPFDLAEAFVTVSGYRWDAYLPHVYRTNDNGATWTDISGNLPDFPVNSIIPDPQVRGTYFIGTDGGVFISRDSGNTWEIFGHGLPRAPVFDMYLHNPTRKLTVATFGRSMHTIAIPAAQGTDDEIASKSDIRAFPNPSEGLMTFTFSLKAAAGGTLSVFDLRGSQAAIIREGDFQAGENRVQWDGSDDRGNRLPAGTYLVRLTTGTTVQSIRIQRI